MEPPPSPRAIIWQDVRDELWDDWKWQTTNSLRQVSALTKLLPFNEQEKVALNRLALDYKMAITPYYFSLINPDDPLDPIRLQVVPSAAELESPSGYALEDPLDEIKDMPVPNLTHRYQDRALIVTTPVCPVYCRFCTRKRATMKHSGWQPHAVKDSDRERLAYIKEHPEIHDVIISGGDPLTLPLARLRFFIEGLEALEHVHVIRIGTRMPVTLPQRLYDPELLATLALSSKIWIQTHFNHPREVTPEAQRACSNLLKLGLPVSNHAVLLKGVNDNPATMHELFSALIRIKVRPYYLFHCDPVVGAGHFRTSIWQGLEIMEYLRGRLSGLAIPTYVVDSPHGGGKIPLLPNYLVSTSPQAVVLRNYEGLLVRYQPEDQALPPSTSKAPTACPIAPENSPPALEGVSALLNGSQNVLGPENTPRMQRRELQRLKTAATGRTPKKLSKKASLKAAKELTSSLEPLKDITSPKNLTYKPKKLTRATGAQLKN